MTIDIHIIDEDNSREGCKSDTFSKVGVNLRLLKLAMRTWKVTFLMIKESELACKAGIVQLVPADEPYFEAPDC